MIESEGNLWLWVGFTVLVFALMALDMGIFGGPADGRLSFRSALKRSVFWVALAGLFGVGVFRFLGSDRALEFYTGYLIEQALSVDNLFVFIVLFGYFRVPQALQQRVLFWGILGAMIMRAVFIILGAALLHRFHWLIYGFGAFLVYTGIKLLRSGDDEEMDPSQNPVLKLFRRFVPMSDELDGNHFFTRRNGRRVATPLALVLVVVEATDVVFAVDSIPAIFAVTTDAFVVYSSNIFAILGLRSLYFLLAGAMVRFAYLNVGLAFVLMFIGAKMLASGAIQIPVVASLGVVAGVLAISIVASLFKKDAPAEKAREEPGKGGE